jgi:HEAT repeat protein
VEGFITARGLRAAALVLGLWASGASGSRAQTPVAPSLTTTLKLGARSLKISAAVEPDGVVLSAGVLKERLPLRDAERVEAEVVELSAGAAAAIVRVSGKSGARAGVVLVTSRGGAPRALFTGALDPRGDPGERRWSTIEVQVAASGAGRTVHVAERAENVFVCGEPPAALAPRVLKSDGSAFVPAPAARLRVDRTVTDVAATTISPGPSAAPRLRALRSAIASSVAGDLPGTPHSPLLALSDGDLKTAWRTAPDAAGEGELASMAVDAAGIPARAVAIVPRPLEAQSGAVPRSVLLVTDAGPALRVAFPEPVAAGQRYWVSLPSAPIRCLSVVVQQSAQLDAQKPEGAMLAEVELYTALDFGDGVAGLIADLKSGGAGAARAVELLQRIGPSVVAPLVEAINAMPPAARARTVRVWAAYSSDGAARTALLNALTDPDERVRSEALEGLARGGAPGHAALAKLTTRDDAVGDASALALSRVAAPIALDAVLTAVAGGATERPKLREALARACERDLERCAASVRAWAAVPERKAEALAVIALALASLAGPDGAPLAQTALLNAELTARALTTDDFAARWRLVSAAERAAPEAAIDAWLVELAQKDERWMLRAAALHALATRKATAASTSAVQALKDEYPRVRLEAVRALAGNAKASAPLTTHAERDRWPMVRAAAYEALALDPSARRALERGLEDKAKSVRASALRGLVTARVAEAWPAVEQRLRDEDEWPEVIVVAMEFARALCVQAAADPLLERLVQALKPNAAPFEAELGAPAFEALAQLGGQAAERAVQIANRPTAPVGLKAMAKRVNPAKSECVSSAPLTPPSAPSSAPSSTP